MLDFREITINDRDKINAALRLSDFQGCEYSFANNLAWRRLSDSQICLYRDFYFIRSLDSSGKPYFSFPAGEGDLKELFSLMKAHAGSRNAPLHIIGATDRSLTVLNELFPDSFSYEPDRDFSDYIYRRSDLAELPGKKYHQKRNHLARFNELDYEFSIIEEKDFDDCICFITGAYNEKDGFSDHSSVAEQFAVNTFFNYYRELGLVGGIIRIDGKTAAVTIGEPLNSNTFCVHIEKADRAVNGLYAGINNCFVKNCMNSFEFVNREEDMGLEGLRKSKLSYHPAYLLNKYDIIFK